MRSLLQLTLITFLCAAAFQSHAQKVPSPYPLYNIFRTDSIQNGVNSHYYDSTLVTLEYDSMHRLVNYKTYRVRNHYWNIDTLKIYSYDSGGAFMAIHISRYDTTAGTFTKIRDVMARYDANARPLYIHTFFYTTIPPSDILNYYSYDASGKTTSTTMLDTAHNYGEKHTYTFNTAGHDSLDKYQLWDGNTWRNFMLNSYFYDSINRPKLQYIYDWDAVYLNWRPKERGITRYDTTGWAFYLDTWDRAHKSWSPASKTIFRGTLRAYCAEFYRWSDTAYVPMPDAPTDCYSYDATGKLLHHYPSGGTLGYYEYIYQYDAAGRIIYSDMIDIGNSRSWYYYYKKYSSVAAARALLLNVTLYPNPCNGGFEVRLPDNFNGSMDIYTMAGQLLQQRNISGQKNVSLHTNLPAGVYFLQVHSTEGFYREKLVIIR